MPIWQFFEIVQRALYLDERASLLLAQTPWRDVAVTVVVVLAGLSQALGQSLVLFASRVKPRRFIYSLFFSSLIFTSSFFILCLALWLVSNYVFHHPTSFNAVWRAVGLGYAPYLFSFFILLPYFGNLISLLLAIWSLLAITTGVHLVTGLDLRRTLLCVGLTWILLQVSERTIGRPIIAAVRWGRRRVAGAPLATSREELYELFDHAQNPRAKLGKPHKQLRTPTS